MKLFELGFPPEDAVTHPRHQRAQRLLAQLISQVRDCESHQDGVEAQRDLLKHLLDVEDARAATSRAIKRMSKGGKAQADAPEPESGGDPTELATWQLENAVAERVARQLRSIGDMLAWRRFGYDRRVILALCRNDSPGPIAGKEGLTAELKFVEDAWREHGCFALLHDLTNCLRIGDVTMFGQDELTFHEIKTNPGRQVSAQLRRIQEAVQALGGGAGLPGGNPRERLYDLDIPLATHLNLLDVATGKAADEGIFAMKVPGSRALVVVDLLGCQARGWDADEFAERFDRQHAAALRRAGINSQHDQHVSATSLDAVSRDPLRVPWGIYPIQPIAAARLIGDVSIVTIETSGPALASDLQRAGIDAAWTLPAGSPDLVAGQVVMEMRSESRTPLGKQDMVLSRTLQLQRSELDRYLIELVDQKCWIPGIRYLLGSPGTPGRPWPVYRDEHLVWA